MPDSINASDIQVNRGFLWRVSFISGLGGILYGYDMGIIAAALIFIRGSFALSTRMQELVVSIVLIGAMLGAIIGGSVADRIGRRATLLWGGILFVVGSILAQLSPNVMTLVVARALLGLAIGFTSVTAPVYISELSPPQSRGRLISLYQFALTLGIALANLVGYWLAAGQAWRTMFGLGVLPAVLFLILVLTLPESPRWLFSVGRMEQAHAVLSTYTNEAGGRLLLEDIQIALQATIDKRWSSLWSPSTRSGLLVAVGFTVLQQVTGINTIIYYGPQIFALAGITADKSAIFATLIVAITNIVFTVVAMVLVDRLGRKPLLYVGVVGMTVSLFVLAYAFQHQAFFQASLGVVATACLVFYIACFAFSMGPIAWILVSEVFPLQVRARGVAAATLGSGASNFVVSVTFLSLIKSAGNAATFATYGFFCIVTLLFVRFIVPETKGRKLESISTKAADAI